MCSWLSDTEGFVHSLPIFPAGLFTKIFVARSTDCSPLVRFGLVEPNLDCLWMIGAASAGYHDVRRNVRKTSFRRRVQMCEGKIDNPWGSRTLDRSILTLENGRYGHHKNLVFWSTIAKCKKVAVLRFWTSVGMAPPRASVRKEEFTPRGRFLNSTLPGLL